MTKKINLSLTKGFIAVTCLILVMVIFITAKDFNSKNKLYENENKAFAEYLLTSFQNKVDAKDSETEISVIENSEDAMSYQVKLLTQMRDINPNEAIQENNLNKTRYYLFNWFASTYLNKNWQALPESDKLPDPITYYGSEWESVRNRIGFPHIEQFEYSVFENMKSGSSSFIYSTNLYLELFDNQIQRATKYSTTPFAFVFLILQTKVTMVFALFALLIPCLMIGSKIKKEKSQRSFYFKNYFLA